MKISNSYYNLGEEFYQKQQPERVKNPKLLVFNEKLAKNLQLDYQNIDLAKVFSGSKLLPKSQPIALAYAGHQFGNFVPQLGDGRAVLLGEITDKNNNLLDIQLKGSGRTFFSRNGDGKCPIDAAIKEYIISEAMYFLKISTTRSLALTMSDELIAREELLPAAVITRIAKSHIRIGTFEYFYYKNDLKNLKILADYTIDRHFPQIKNKDNPYLYLVKSVMKLQAELVSNWMSIGFIHGVMNTDNSSISGQTIDYGPCAFMDQYQKDKSFSFIDSRGRYSFSNQKHIILWNLIKFTETILPLINNNIKKAVKIAGPELNKFQPLFEKLYLKKMAKKIGIFTITEQDVTLIGDFLNILEENQLDFTNSFRILSKILKNVEKFPIQNNKYLNWQQRWLERLKEQDQCNDEIAVKIDKINPILIPRNHIVKEIINQAISNNNYLPLQEFLKIIEEPFTENQKYNKYYQIPKKNQIVVNTFCGT